MDGLMDTLLNGREELDAGITHFVSMCDKKVRNVVQYVFLQYEMSIV